MRDKQVFNIPGMGHFVTFSCHQRRRLLSNDQCKRIAISILASELKHNHTRCLGFVIMPDHVHALIFMMGDKTISQFMWGWKQRSSLRIGRILRECSPDLGHNGPVWQRRYYDFNVYSPAKIIEKLH